MVVVVVVVIIGECISTAFEDVFPGPVLESSASRSDNYTLKGTCLEDYKGLQSSKEEGEISGIKFWWVINHPSRCK